MSGVRSFKDMAYVVECVTPDDVRAVVHDCLRHRVALSYEANAARKTTDEVVGELVKVVAVA